MNKTVKEKIEDICKLTANKTCDAMNGDNHLYVEILRHTNNYENINGAFLSINVIRGIDEQTTRN